MHFICIIFSLSLFGVRSLWLQEPTHDFHCCKRTHSTCKDHACVHNSFGMSSGDGRVCLYPVCNVGDIHQRFQCLYSFQSYRDLVSQPRTGCRVPSALAKDKAILHTPHHAYTADGRHTRFELHHFVRFGVERSTSGCDFHNISRSPSIGHSSMRARLCCKDHYAISRVFGCIECLVYRCAWFAFGLSLVEKP